MNFQAGLDLAFQRAKAWSKYLKDIMAYIERRAQLGMNIILIIGKADKKAMIRNQYNQIPHPAPNTKQERKTNKQDSIK